MDDNSVQTRKMAEAQLLDRAMKDPAFRAELAANPREVFNRELGLEMPEHITVEVLEETPSTVYLVLPAPVAAVGAQLSDAELENVAGGWTMPTECGVSCAPSCNNYADPNCIP